MSLNIVKLYDCVKIPIRGSAESAGADIFCPRDELLEPFKQTLIKTGLSVQVPQGHYGRIAPRSSLALKENLWINAGVIDRDFTGEVGVIIMNMNQTNFLLKKDTRFCQLICERISIPNIRIVSALPRTERSDGGFGSTDRK